MNTMPSAEATVARRQPMLQLLGGFTYWNGSKLIHLPGTIGSVVAFIALQPGPVLRSVVSGNVWPDVTEDRSSGNLRSVLWRTKKAADGLIVSSGSTLSIDPSVVVDFTSISSWADRLIHHTETPADLDRDLSMLRLELLPGLYDEWVSFERERLRQRRLHAAEVLARRLLEDNRYAEAIECSLTAIAADPLRESAHRVAVECHLAEHNVVEAHRQQTSYVRLLRTELGLTPSSEFMGLVENPYDLHVVAGIVQTAD